MHRNSRSASPDRPGFRAAELLLVVLLAISSSSAATLGAVATPAARGDAGPVLPGSRTAVDAATRNRLSAYAIEATLDPDAGTIRGTETVRFRNDTGADLSEIAFRLYPNAAYYGNGDLAVSALRVDGRAAAPEYRADGTAMLAPLGAKLAPGAKATVTLDFTTTVPSDSTGSYGIFSHDTPSGTWVLADWYPIVAGWEAATGWNLDRPTDLGDPTVSDAAFYDVTLTAPAALAVVATGDETIAETRGGETRWRIAAGPVREFTLIADADMTAISAMTGDTRVSVYTNPGAADETAARLALRSAVDALSAYSVRLGLYPYDQLDLVATPILQALGVSWTGLIFLNDRGLLGNPALARDDPARFAFTVAHEVGHQWWGASVGSNSNASTFIVEGLTNALAVVALEDAQGLAVACAQLGEQIVGPYLSALARFGDGVVDVPATTPRDGPPRGALDYGKAALGFLAIRAEIGDPVFFAALRSYAADFAFRVSTPADLKSSLERAAGRDLTALWTSWFASATTTTADVRALLGDPSSTVVPGACPS